MLNIKKSRSIKIGVAITILYTILAVAILLILDSTTLNIILLVILGIVNYFALISIILRLQKSKWFLLTIIPPLIIKLGAVIILLLIFLQIVIHDYKNFGKYIDPEAVLGLIIAIILIIDIIFNLILLLKSRKIKWIKGKKQFLRSITLIFIAPIGITLASVFIFGKIPIGGRFYKSITGVYFLDNCRTVTIDRGCTRPPRFVRIKGANFLTFTTFKKRPCSNRETSDICYWAKDKNRIYKLEPKYYTDAALPDLKVQTITNVDIKTFKVLNNSFQKDKNYVYYESEIIKNLSPESFEILDSYYGKTNSWYVFKNKPFKVEHPESFEIISNYRALAKDKKFLYYQDNKVSHPELDINTVKISYNPDKLKVNLGSWAKSSDQLLLEDSKNIYTITKAGIVKLPESTYRSLPLLREIVNDSSNSLKAEITDTDNLQSYAYNRLYNSNTDSDNNFKNFYTTQNLNEAYDQILNTKGKKSTRPGRNFTIVPYENNLYFARPLLASDSGNAYILNATELILDKYTENMPTYMQMPYYEIYGVYFNGIDGIYYLSLGDNEAKQLITHPKGFTQLNPTLIADSRRDYFYSFYVNDEDPSHGAIAFFKIGGFKDARIYEFKLDVDPKKINNTIEWYTYEDDVFTIIPNLKGTDNPVNIRKKVYVSKEESHKNVLLQQPEADINDSWESYTSEVYSPNVSFRYPQNSKLICPEDHLDGTWGFFNPEVRLDDYKKPFGTLEVAITKSHPEFKQKETTLKNAKNWIDKEKISSINVAGYEATIVDGITPGDRYPYKTKYYFASIFFDTGRNYITIEIKDYPDKRNYDTFMNIVKSLRLVKT